MFLLQQQRNCNYVCGTTFNTTVDGVNYQFVTISDVTSRNTGSSIPFDSLEIYEGTFTRTKYIVNSQEADQRFMLTDVRADTTTLTVKFKTLHLIQQPLHILKQLISHNLQKIVQFTFYKKLKVVDFKFTLEMVQQVKHCQMEIL